jgi:uncharacterized protein (DUF1810 family)
MMPGVSQSDPYNLQRFIDAQDGVFESALDELRDGCKRSHWMWFVFPQLAGLGRTPTAQYFSIGTIEEARAYLAHPRLGHRLCQSVEVLLPWAGQRSAERIFGPIDAMKLRSSLTLFDRIEPSSIFHQALAAFYGGKPDARTLALLNGEA